MTDDVVAFTETMDSGISMLLAVDCEESQIVERTQCTQEDVDRVKRSRSVMALDMLAMNGIHDYTLMQLVGNIKRLDDLYPELDDQKAQVNCMKERRETLDKMFFHLKCLVMLRHHKNRGASG